MNPSEFFTRLLNPKERAARSAAKTSVGETTKLVRRARSSLSVENQTEVKAAIAATQEALRGDDLQAITTSQARLDDLAERHLQSYRKPGWRESLDSMSMAVIVALLLRSFVIEAFKIPSGSMIPTLAIGDQIFVNKYVYGVRIPFTSIRLVNFALPKRGDVIVFICPEPPNEDYIKRVIGLPGDEVRVEKGIVFINGEPIKRDPLGGQTYWDSDARGVWHPLGANAYRETVGDKQYITLQDTDMSRSAADFGPFVVPPDHVWMMGDNRDHSYDSRAWGPVPVQNILGRSMFVWFSWGRDGIATQRFGTWIE